MSRAIGDLLDRVCAGDFPLSKRNGGQVIVIHEKETVRGAMEVSLASFFAVISPTGRLSMGTTFTVLLYGVTSRRSILEALT